MINQSNQNPSLIGRWRQIEPSNDAEEVTMSFGLNGELVYTIDTEEKTQFINLVFEISEDTLITDQPSAPQKEYTKFYFESDNLLVLDYDGDQTKFQRIC
jgi:hypothetical protein